MREETIRSDSSSTLRDGSVLPFPAVSCLTSFSFSLGGFLPLLDRDILLLGLTVTFVCSIIISGNSMFLSFSMTSGLCCANSVSLTALGRELLMCGVLFSTLLVIFIFISLFFTPGLCRRGGSVRHLVSGLVIGVVMLLSMLGLNKGDC